MLLQLIKARYLFAFLSENNPNLLNSYLRKFESETYDKFLTKVFPIFYSAFNAMRKIEGDNETYDPTFTILNVENEADRNFLNKFIINSSKIDEEVDFISIRNSPMISVSNSEYILLNDLFIIQKIFSGAYFELKSLYVPKGRQSNFRSYFTTEFSEEYLFYKIMDSIYQNRNYKRMSGKAIKATYRIQGEPDYYIRNGNKIFLFESKDIFIAAPIKWSYNLVEIKAFIDNKLVNREGIPQLINNIKKIKNSSIVYDDNKQSSKADIYPIIITHRAEFDTPGLNLYLNQEFRNQIEASGLSHDLIAKVKDLTVINIDFFILFDRALKSKGIELERIIDDYHKWTKNRNIHERMKVSYLKRYKKNFCLFLLM